MKPLTPAIAVLLTAWLTHAGSACADEVKFYKAPNGDTVRETRQVVSRWLPETKLQQQERTVYRYNTTMQPSVRTYQVPVTQYQWVQSWERASWNPFSQPSLTYRLVHSTKMETRTETVRIPVTQLVPAKQVEQVPVVTGRMVQDEHIERVVVASPPPTLPAVSTDQTSVASRDLMGGLKLESDPPRDGAWRSADPSVRR